MASSSTSTEDDLRAQIAASVAKIDAIKAKMAEFAADDARAEQEVDDAYQRRVALSEEVKDIERQIALSEQAHPAGERKAPQSSAAAGKVKDAAPAGEAAAAGSAAAAPRSKPASAKQKRARQSGVSSEVEDAPEAAAKPVKQRRMSVPAALEPAPSGSGTSDEPAPGAAPTRQGSKKGGGAAGAHAAAPAPAPAAAPSAAPGADGIAEPTEAEARAAAADGLLGTAALFSPSFLAAEFRTKELEDHLQGAADAAAPGAKGTSCLRLLIERAAGRKPLGMRGFVMWEEAWDRRHGRHSVELKFLAYDAGGEDTARRLLDAMCARLHTTSGGEMLTKLEERPSKAKLDTWREFGFTGLGADGWLHRRFDAPKK